MSFLIAGAIAAAAGSLVSGKMGASAAEKQAKAQKQAANRYAKALRQQASKMQGGMSQARLRSLQAAGSLQRASEAQQSRTEAARGGRAPSAMLEAELAAAQQMASVEQQKMLDQLSQQTSERKAATRQQLQSSALQAEAQAQAIDPKAAARAAFAPAVGQTFGALAAPAMQYGMAQAMPKAKFTGTAAAIGKLDEAKLNLTEDQRFDLISGLLGGRGSNMRSSDYDRGMSS